MNCLVLRVNKKYGLSVSLVYWIRSALALVEIWESALGMFVRLSTILWGSAEFYYRIELRCCSVL